MVILGKFLSKITVFLDEKCPKMTIVCPKCDSWRSNQDQWRSIGTDAVYFFLHELFYPTYTSHLALSYWVLWKNFSSVNPYKLQKKSPNIFGKYVTNGTFFFAKKTLTNYCEGVTILATSNNQYTQPSMEFVSQK